MVHFSNSNPLMVECANVAVMRELSNYSNNSMTIGKNGVQICISHNTHYFVVLDEAYRARAMRWMLKHIKGVNMDLYGEDEFGFFTYSSRLNRFMQYAMHNAEGLIVCRPHAIQPMPKPSHYNLKTA